MSLNCTARTPTLSDADARTVILPETLARRLGQDLFQVPRVRESFAVVQSRGLDLRFRLALAPGDL